MNTFEELPNNPFLPGHPVSPESFIGRKKNVKKILRYFPRVINQGIPEHFFITGKRGMGKTSFIRYVADLAENEYNMFPIYINNEGSNTIDELIANLLDALFKEFNKTNWGQQIIDSFFNKFKQISFKGIEFEFREYPEVVKNVKNNFIDFLVETCDNLDENLNGIFIIIDDINGLSHNPDFANWYKALFETLEFNNEYVPIAFNLVTYPKKFDQLCEQNPSFPRMFNLINIDRLSDRDVENFFIKNFKKFNIEFENNEYLNQIVYYSWGMPLIMQQIGDSIFWNMEKNTLNDEIIYEGIRNAAIELKNKPLKNTLNKIKNPHYYNILLKLGENEKIIFQKQELSDLLNNNEKSVLDDFIKNMMILDIIEVIDEENQKYEFVNIAYYVYFLISSTFKNIL